MRVQIDLKNRGERPALPPRPLWPCLPLPFPALTPPPPPCLPCPAGHYDRVGFVAEDTSAKDHANEVMRRCEEISRALRKQLGTAAGDGERCAGRRGRAPGRETPLLMRDDGRGG